MIVNEIIELNGCEYKRTYSDGGYQIRKVNTNEVYSEAVDLLDSEFEYEETSDMIDERRID